MQILIDSDKLALGLGYMILCLAPLATAVFLWTRYEIRRRRGRGKHDHD